MLRIRRIVDGEFIVSALSGSIDDESLAHLESLIEGERHEIVIDLQEVNLVSREGVSFLVNFEEHGGSLKNCPPYIREWINRERNRN
jgi:anti-anti-sigma regulatory factor